MNTLKLFSKIAILLLILISFGCNKVEDTITLIPNNFRGTVKIWFNQENGENEFYEGEFRVYRIPKDGILNTKFSKQHGWHYPKYFYETIDNRRIEIEPLGHLNDSLLATLNSTKTYAYNFLNLGNTIKVDSLGNETDLNNAGIIFTVGNPLND